MSDMFNSIAGSGFFAQQALTASYDSNGNAISSKQEALTQEQLSAISSVSGKYDSSAFSAVSGDFLTTISGDFSGDNVSANNFFINGRTDHSYMRISAKNDTIKYEQCNQGGIARTIDVEGGHMTFSSSNSTSNIETIIKPGEITISSDAMPGNCVIMDAKGVSSINNGVTNVTTWVKIINAANSI